MRRLWVLAALLFALPAHAEVALDWVTVGDPGNPADTEIMGDGTTGYGVVAYRYRISRYETTNAQYAEFLNAVAATDTNALYDPSMGSSTHGGITRSGSPGSFSYSVKAGMDSKPVTYVSFWDSLRFANWLHNGQPTGAQDASTTEDGAYTITAQGIADNSITRNGGATIFLPSEDEWYKAAYYDAVSDGYFDYPTGTDSETTCAAPGATPNTANCWSIVGTVTDVGAYSGTASQAGTFDQGANVWEWSDTIVQSFRVLRGGSWSNPPSYFRASARNYNYPEDEFDTAGFRVAAVAQPQPMPALSPVGVALLGGLVCGIGIVGLAIAARRDAWAAALRLGSNS